MTPEAKGAAGSRGRDETASATDLDPDRLRAGLVGRRVGAAIEVRATVGSTMDELAALAAAGADEGRVLLADEQRAGRGRHGRVWHTPPGVALALSVLFRPTLPVERLPQVPMAVALAALDALAPRVPDPFSVALKWPNDLVVIGAGQGGGEAKIAGLLSEVVWARAETPEQSTGVAGGEQPPASTAPRPRLIVGLGLNVRQGADALPAGATSVAALWHAAGRGGSAGSAATPAARPIAGDAGPRTSRVGAPLDRTALAIDLLRALDRHYAALREGADLVPAWSRRLATIGRAVVAHPATDGGLGDNDRRPPVAGHAVGVDGSGALRIATDQGEVLVHAGDVTLQRPTNPRGTNP